MTVRIDERPRIDSELSGVHRIAAEAPCRKGILAGVCGQVPANQTLLRLSGRPLAGAGQ